MARKGIPQRIKNQVLVRQRGQCNDCNRVLKHIDFHHADGDNTNSLDENNIVALCPNCHRDRHGKDREGRESLKEERQESGSILDFQIPNFEIPKLGIPKLDLRGF